jgi:hypothetical protein
MQTNPSRGFLREGILLFEAFPQKPLDNPKQM